MIFIDTSAIYALADRADPNHHSAGTTFGDLLRSGAALWTHNYVLVESMALLQRRLGTAPATALARDARAFEIEWITRPIHAAAVEALAARDSRRVSLVDQVTFLVMRQHGITRAFAFDGDFAEEGFELVAARVEPADDGV